MSRSDTATAAKPSAYRWTLSPRGTLRGIVAVPQHADGRACTTADGTVVQLILCVRPEAGSWEARSRDGRRLLTGKGCEFPTVERCLEALSTAHAWRRRRLGHPEP